MDQVKDSWFDTVLRLNPRGRITPSATCVSGLSVLRWGDASCDRSEHSLLSTVQVNPVYQSYVPLLHIVLWLRLVATGSSCGHIHLFRNDYSSQASINRTMNKIYISSANGLSTKPHSMTVSTVRFMEEHVLVSASLDGSIRIWDCTQSMSVSDVFGIQGRDGITSMEPVKLFGEGSVVMTGTKSGALYIRDFRFSDGQGDKSVTTHSDAVCSIAMDDCFEVASGDLLGRVEVRDMRSLRSAPLISLNGSRLNTDSHEIRNSHKFSDIKKEDHSILSEDMWDIAMGKKASKRRSVGSPRDDIPVRIRTARDSKPVTFENAHSRRVILVHFVSPNLIITLGQDKLVKLFSSSSGLMLQSLQLRDKPLSAAVARDTVFVGDRNGITIVGVSLSEQTMQRVANPHTGSVSALGTCAEWGLCSGGTDQHIFLHSLAR